MKSKTFSLECYVSEFAKILKSLLTTAVVSILIVSSFETKAGGPLCTQTSDCDDGNVCTIDSCDLIFGCQWFPVTCSDGDSCTLDVCDVLTGCTFPPDPLCFPTSSHHIVDFGGVLGLTFLPSNFVVYVGDTVTWIGDFSEPHTVTSTSVPAGAASFFQGAGPFTTFSYIVTVAGDYFYQCDFHFMT
jgi:hypothetical protein